MSHDFFHTFININNIIIVNNGNLILIQTKPSQVSSIKLVNLLKNITLHFLIHSLKQSKFTDIFNTATSLLKEKACKALFMLKQTNIQNNIRVGTKFFSSLILPIINILL